MCVIVRKLMDLMYHNQIIKDAYVEIGIIYLNIGNRVKLCDQLLWITSFRYMIIRYNAGKYILVIDYISVGV